MGRIWQFVRQVVNQELASDNDERSAVSICEPDERSPFDGI